MVFEPHYISYEALAKMVDGVFIGLHGRPGEDGTVQRSSMPWAFLIMVLISIHRV